MSYRFKVVNYPKSHPLLLLHSSSDSTNLPNKSNDYKLPLKQDDNADRKKTWLWSNPEILDNLSYRILDNKEKCYNRVLLVMAYYKKLVNMHSTALVSSNDKSMVLVQTIIPMQYIL